MKKLLSFLIIFVIVISNSSIIFAADEYSFDIQYTGTVTKNIEKNANVLLVGVGGTLYTNVRIKVDIIGPATPVILATDTNQSEIDIAQEGYWGPPTGFPVQGDFTNTTPIKATFPEEGTYTITLSLINVNNSNSVITSKSFTIEVFEDIPPAVDNVVNNTTQQNTIEELPKTGTSVVEYAMYIIGLAIIIAIVGIYINKKKIRA